MEYDFDLVLSGTYDEYPEDIEATIVNDCPDSNGFGMSNCVCKVNFYIEADTFREAVLIAIKQLESSGIPATVERVEPDELVSSSDIGRRVGVTREAVRLYANGDRGPGGFPGPVATPSKTVRVWKWLDVVNWLRVHGIGNVSDDMAEHAATVATINAALELRKHIGTKKALTDLWKDLQTPAMSKG